MSGVSLPSRRPGEAVATARAFYADLVQEVGYFPARWPNVNVGPMLATDLDRIGRQHDLSIADFTSWARCGSIGRSACPLPIWR